MKYQVPLSEADAGAIRHAAEIRILQCATGGGEPGDYGEALYWLESLMRGEAVEIPDTALAESRAVLGHTLSVLHHNKENG